MLFKYCLTICFLFLLPILVFAQNSGDEAKEKERRKNALLEQIVSDSVNLKLGENRALVFAKVGNQIWTADETRARALFQKAIGELVGAQMLVEAESKNRGNYFDLLHGQTTRPQILNIIASRDAELALEYLVKSRPAAIAKALAFQPPTENSKIINNSAANQRNFAAGELNLEQQLIRLAADQKPERAVRLLKESLKKGFSGETLNLLKKLHQKDPEAADEFVSEITGKLAQIKFSGENQPDYQSINTVVIFLNEFIREKSPTEKTLKFDDAQMRSLAERLISFCLRQSGEYGFYSPYQVIPIAEKLAPAAVEQLKKMQSNTWRRGGFYVESSPELNKLLSSDATAEQLLAEAKKFSPNLRRQIYQKAAGKFMLADNISRATEILSENFADDALEEMMRNLNWGYSHHLINSGKFTEAERIIDEMPENQRHNSYINLANAIYQKNPAENKSYAVAVLEKARFSVGEKPETSTEMSHLMQIVAAYSNIEPAEAFRLFEPLIPQMNELSDAAVLLNSFQGSSNIRQGEFLMTQGLSYGFYGADFSVLSALAKKDFDRAMNLIDTFTRREIRIALKMHLAEGALN